MSSLVESNTPPFFRGMTYRYMKYLRQVQILEYHLFRSVFLRLNRSLLTPAFDFAKYSASIVDEIIISHFDFGWRSWLMAVIVFYFTLPITPEVRHYN